MPLPCNAHVRTEEGSSKPATSKADAGHGRPQKKERDTVASEPWVDANLIAARISLLGFFFNVRLESEIVGGMNRIVSKPIEMERTWP